MTKQREAPRFFGRVVFWGGALSELSERLDSLLSYSSFFCVCVWCRTDEQKEAKKKRKETSFSQVSLLLSKKKVIKNTREKDTLLFT